MMNENGVVLEARGLTRVYRRGSEEIRAIDGVTLQIRHGDNCSTYSSYEGLKLSSVRNKCFNSRIRLALMLSWHCI